MCVFSASLSGSGPAVRTLPGKWKNPAIPVKNQQTNCVLIETKHLCFYSVWSLFSENDCGFPWRNNEEVVIKVENLIKHFLKLCLSSLLTLQSLCMKQPWVRELHLLLVTFNSLWFMHLQSGYWSLYKSIYVSIHLNHKHYTFKPYAQGFLKKKMYVSHLHWLIFSALNLWLLQFAWKQCFVLYHVRLFAFEDDHNLYGTILYLQWYKF